MATKSKSTKFNVTRDSVEAESFRLCPLLDCDEVPQNFSGDADLDDFFINDCHLQQAKLLSKTYKFTVQLNGHDSLVGLVAIANDSLNMRGHDENIPGDLTGKPYKVFPAAKIARLAIDSRAQGVGFGTQLVAFVKAFF